MPNILLIEDDIAFVNLIKNFLEKNGHTVNYKRTLKESREEIKEKSYDLILLDYHLPDGDAFDVLTFLHQHAISWPVVIMTGFHDVRTAVKAMRLGVSDYITKPVNPEELAMILKTIFQKEKVSEELPVKNTSVKGESMISQELYRHIELIAPTKMSVIIQGESGTGKENVARSIHQQSNFSSGPFIALDCGALSDELASSELFGHVRGSFTGANFDKKGAFESADGGTLFLDEVGNLSYAVQVKLLRAVQERVIQPVGSNKIIKVNVRIITATNDDLRSSVKNGSFREDLFHRLNEFQIYVPPLRERTEDLHLFISHFIEEANSDLSKKVTGVSLDVLTLFKKYNWPGNLRELKNIVKRSVLLSSGALIRQEDIPAEMHNTPENPVRSSDSDLKLMKEVNEKELIVRTLKEVKFNKTKAAALLNIDRKTLYLKIMRYGIEG
ncbi:sigma-54-dependent Fis family transcriptional regulator [Sphingobacteriaceae bacterium]|nr:sigma-54-dependent Fis family transcriptional regulator [Sphingobacteriaceae bacterium]